MNYSDVFAGQSAVKDGTAAGAAVRNAKDEKKGDDCKGQNSSFVNYANIMLLGRTGVGKSSFINYLVGKDVCMTGTGEPVTQGFNEYKNDDISGIPLRVFDSKGLEVRDYETIDRDIEQFVQEHSGSENVFDWIHSIFYCVNVESSRVESEEINFIKRLGRKTSQTIHIVITHCDNKTPEGIQRSEAMKEYVLSQLENENVRVYCVNSVETVTRKGIFGAFGRKEILDQIFILLWSDIAHKIAREYAQEMRYNLLGGCSLLDHAFQDMLQQFSIIKLISDGLNGRDDMTDRMSEEFDKYESQAEEILEKLNESYQKKIEPLVAFCHAYGKSCGYSIEVYDPFDFVGYDLDDMDLDDFLNHTKFGRFMTEIDDIPESDSIGEIMGSIVKLAGGLLKMKSLLKELCDEIVQELRSHIPCAAEIEKNIYSALMENVEAE